MLIFVVYVSLPGIYSFIISCVLFILIVTCTHWMVPTKTHRPLETVDMRVAVWPRNYLAHRNLGLHQAAEGRRLKYSHSFTHPDWLMRHLMQVCILPGVQSTEEGFCLRDVAAQSRGTAH